MHVVVAGASGATGQRLVAQAVTAGHRVTALVRDARRYRGPEGVEVVETDVVAHAWVDLPADADVVVSTLGKRSFDDDAPVCQRGVAHLLMAMRRQGVARIVVVSAAPVLRRSRGEPWWFRMTVLRYVRWTGRRVYADLEQMEAILRGTGDWCQWTVLRPNFLTDDPQSGAYRMAVEDNVHGTTRRADLVDALLRVADDRASIGRSYGVASR